MTRLSCVCKLTEDPTKGKEAAPEFRVQMHDISTNVGEPATFDCHVIGFPRPEVFWTKASDNFRFAFCNVDFTHCGRVTRVGNDTIPKSLFHCYTMKSVAQFSE